MTVDLQAALQEHGLDGRAVPIEHLAELEQEIAARRKLLDGELYERYLSGFAFHSPADLPEARSVIIVAVPHPQVSVSFEWQGRIAPFITPPTYLRGRETDQQASRILEQRLAPLGYHVAEILLPKKLLAARSGLAVYGKNNITYIARMGSFYRLAAFCSDLPCAADPWGDPQMMERCEKCRACLRACPTSAIAADRFLLHSERCLTFHNEKDSPVSFPSWLDPSWHQCLIGCMQCQAVCPEDKEFVDWVEDGPSFSEQETRLLLDGALLDALPATTVEKLQRFELDQFYEALSRNLRILLERQVRD